MLKLKMETDIATFKVISTEGMSEITCLLEEAIRDWCTANNAAYGEIIVDVYRELTIPLDSGGNSMV